MRVIQPFPWKEDTIGSDTVAPIIIHSAVTGATHYIDSVLARSDTIATLQFYDGDSTVGDLVFKVTISAASYVFPYDNMKFSVSTDVKVRISTLQATASSFLLVTGHLIK